MTGLVVGTWRGSRVALGHWRAHGLGFAPERCIWTAGELVHIGPTGYIVVQVYILRAPPGTTRVLLRVESRASTSTQVRQSLIVRYWTRGLAVTYHADLRLACLVIIAARGMTNEELRTVLSCTYSYCTQVHPITGVILYFNTTSTLPYLRYLKVPHGTGPKDPFSHFTPCQTDSMEPRVQSPRFMEQFGYSSCLRLSFLASHLLKCYGLAAGLPPSKLHKLGTSCVFASRGLLLAGDQQLQPSCEPGRGRSFARALRRGPGTSPSKDSRPDAHVHIPLTYRPNTLCLADHVP